MTKAIGLAVALLVAGCGPTLAERQAAARAAEAERARAASVAERARVRAASAAFDGDQRVFEFMRVRGMSRAAAEAKVAAIDEHMRIVNALEPKLRAEHRGNYIDHIGNFWEGEPCVLMMFRRDGAAILKSYGVDRPSIRAIDTPYSSDEFRTMMLPWWDRFWRAGIRVTPYQRPDLGKLIFQLHGEWADHADAAKREGWSLPDWLEVRPKSWTRPRYTCR